MAGCQDCGQEMRTAAGCTIDSLIIGDRRFARYRVGRLRDDGSPCGDCGARRPDYHHLGCDRERCPCCGWQLLSCGCWHPDDRDEEGQPDPALVQPLLAHCVVAEEASA